MKYQAYYKGSKVKATGWTFEMAQSDPLHRKEVMAWLNSIDDPVLDEIYDDQGQKTVRILFEAPPANLTESVAATCRMVVVRSRGKDQSQSETRPRPGRWRTKMGKIKGDRWGFPYRFEYDKNIADSQITMPYKEIEFGNMINWTTGEHHKNIQRLYDQYRPHQANINFMDEWTNPWVKQFYIGIVYFNEKQTPTIFKMFPLNIEYER